jgi:trigger factor
MKVGDTIRFDPNHFLKRGDMEMFKRYYLDIDDVNATLADKIEGQILTISALKPAEVNEEFFNSAFEPGTVSSEEQARGVIAKVLKQRNDAQSDVHLRHMIEHQLIDANQIELPYEFIDRLIEATNGESDKEKTSPEKQSNAFRWHFIKDKLSRKFAIEVSREEIVRAAADRLYDRFGSSIPYERMKELIERFLSDKDSVEQLRNSVADTKLFYALKEHMPVVKKETTVEEFRKMQEEHRHEH